MNGALWFLFVILLLVLVFALVWVYLLLPYKANGSAQTAFFQFPTPIVGSMTGYGAGTTNFSIISTGGNDNYNCGGLGQYCNPALGLICQTGTCVCADPNLTFCPSYGCVDLQTFSLACGSCNNPTCSGTSRCCSGACLPINTTSNCGACGNRCTGGTGARMGCCAGACVDMASSNVHCGSCFNSIAATGFRCCAGTPTPINDQNCTACGQTCPTGFKCDIATQTCIPGCPAGQTLCNGQCKNLAQDNFNCTFCGTPCPPGTYCFASQCIANTCPDPDQFFVQGSCITLTTNENCGQFGNRCPTFCKPNGSCNCTANVQCPQGFSCDTTTNQCIPPSCPAGQVYCSQIQACINLNQGDGQGRSCGACGINCPSGVCDNGTCACASTSQCLLGYDCVAGRCVKH